MYNKSLEASSSNEGPCHFSYGPLPQNGSNSGMPNAKTSSKNKGSFPGWFKLLIAIIFAGIIFGFLGLIFAENIASVVEEQLEKIKENRITQAYYDFTSKEFQSSTSLEAFREFINSYPVLAKHKKFILEKKAIYEKEGSIKGVLISENLHEMDVEYRLVKEGHSWKIQSLRLNESLRNDPPDTSSLALIHKVDGQLKALRDKDATEAYYGFVSKDFQNETSLDAFQKFVQSHSILSLYKGVEYKARKIINDEGFVNLILNSDHGDFFLEYKLVRENGDWKIWSLKLILSPEEAEKAVATDPKAMESSIRSFLDYLHLGDISAAYESTAKEFQETTSIEAFNHFIAYYPVLIERDLVDIKNGQIEDGVGRMHVNLHDEKGMTVIQFRLGFESGDWKIWGVQVLEQPNQKSTFEKKNREKEDFAIKLQNIIQKHLEDLRYQNIPAAYNSMSERYKFKNPLKEFDDYIVHHPEFGFNRTSQLHRIALDKKKVSLHGEITSFDYETYPIKYVLVKENGDWKIDSFVTLTEQEPIAQNEFNLNNPIRTPLKSPFEITKIEITSSDREGHILPSTNNIDKNASFIYINVSVKNGQKGTVIKAVLEHVDSSSSAPFISTSLESNGDLIIAFSYAAPKRGWPTGEYIVKVTAFPGLESIKKFTIN
jgi:hypothetical protein